MERASRLLVLGSALAAGAAHAWLVVPVLPAVPWTAAAAFAVSVALTRVSLALAMTPPLVIAYLAPALMTTIAAQGRSDPLVWLALIGGVVAGASDWSRWHTPPSWTRWLIGWSTLLALTWPIVAGREIDFSLIAARTFDTPNGLRAAPPPLAAAAVTGTVLGQLIGLLWVDLLWSRFGPNRVGRAERCAIVPLVVSAIVASAAGVYQRYVNPQWLMVPEWMETGRAGSLLLDANSFGMAAAIWAPLALVLAADLKRPMWWGVAASAVLAGGVWVSGSRTAFVTALAGLGAWLAARAFTADVRARRAAGLAAAVIAGLLVVAAFGSSDRANPVARLADSVRGTEASAESILDYLWNRYGYGLAATRAISEHSLTGVGAGGFGYLSTDYAYLATGAIIAPDNAQNWWRHQIAELGFAGAVWSIGFSIVVLIAALRSPRPASSPVTALVLRAMILALGLISLVGVPTQHPAIWITFTTLLYWLGALSRSSTDPAPLALQPRRAIAAAALVVAAIVGAGQAWSAAHDLRVPHRARRIGFPYAYGFSAPDGDGVPWMASHAVAVLGVQHAYFAIAADAPDLPGTARLRLWRDGRLILDEEITRDAAVTRVLRIPGEQTFVMVEGELSGAGPAGRGVRFNGRWLRELPPGTAPHEIVD